MGNIVYATGGTTGYTGRVTSVHTTVPQGASSTTGGFANTDAYTPGGGFGDAPLNDIARRLVVGGKDGGSVSTDSLSGTLQMIVAWGNDYSADNANIRDFIDSNTL